MKEKGDNTMNENIWFGHPEELAKLAAAVSPGKSPAEAVAYAVELCRESVEAVNRIALEEGAPPGLGFYPFITDSTVDRIQKLENWKKIAPMPEALPATIADFFDLIVKAKTPSDCTKRMRDFFSQVYFGNDNDPQSRAAAQIQRIKQGDQQGGYFTQTRWEIMGGCYCEWWKGEKSRKAGQSARQRKKKSS